MAFWGSDTIRQRQITDYLILPYDDKQIKNGCYQLSVGPEYYVTLDDVKKEIKDNHGQIVIESGQFAILLSEEIVSIPKNAIGFISIRAGIKFKGLVNVSGFHVDPGFSGRLKFAVYNAGPKNIVLSRGQAAFPLWFCDMDDGNSDEYDGTHKDQRHITADDVNNLQGQMTSPSALKNELIELKHDCDNKYEKLKHTITIWTSIVMTLLSLMIGILVRDYFINSNSKSNPTQQSQTITNDNFTKNK